MNWVQRTLESHGLEDVKVNVLSHLTPVESAAFFVSAYSMMIEWVMNAHWSEELRKEHGKEEVLGLIKEFLEEKYQGGSWSLTWTSIIATGRVPS